MARRFQHVELQADVTTATMLFTMVEALEAAKAPLQHVYASQVGAQPAGQGGDAGRPASPKPYSLLTFWPGGAAGHQVLRARSQAQNGCALVMLRLRAGNGACANTCMRGLSW